MGRKWRGWKWRGAEYPSNETVRSPPFPLTQREQNISEVQAILTILSRPVTDFEGYDSTDDGSEYNGFDDSKEEEWWREDESEDLDCEQDIEEHEYTTSGDTARAVKIRLFLTDEGMGEFDLWMKNFVAECTCDGVAIAIALARYIDREGMRSEF